MDTDPPPAARAKDFLSIVDLDHAALGWLLDRARQMKADRRHGKAATQVLHDCLPIDGIRERLTHVHIAKDRIAVIEADVLIVDARRRAY